MTIQKLGGITPQIEGHEDVPCRECGTIVRWPKEILAWLTERAVVCDPCIDKFERSDPNSKHAKRCDSFEAYCPKLYKTILEKELPERMSEIVRTWTPLGGRGLLIHGPSGTYKTTTMWSVVKKQWIEYNRRATVVSAVELSREIASSFDRKHGYEDLSNRYSNALLLCIDDLGKERMTPRVEEAIFEISNVRFERKSPTIFTTNFVGESLQNRFIDEETGKAFVRRVRDYMDIRSSITQAEQTEMNINA